MTNEDAKKVVELDTLQAKLDEANDYIADLEDALSKIEELCRDAQRVW